MENVLQKNIEEKAVKYKCPRYWGYGTLKRPNMSKCKTKVRWPSPILIKFGSGGGFGPKTTPPTFFPPIGPVNPPVRASKGSKFGIFENPIFGHKMTQDGSREYPKAPLAPEYARDRPRKISRGYAKRQARYGQLCAKHMLLIKVFYTLS